MKQWTIRAIYVDKKLKNEKKNGVVFARFDANIHVSADTIEEALREAHTYLGTDYEITHVAIEETCCPPVNGW